MSKQPNIRWRKRDQDDLRKAVKNFNAKITRLERSRPELASVLPDRVSVKDLHGSIKSRKEFNSKMHKLRDFAKREISSGYDIHRKSTISWSDADEKALRSAVDKFNRKIDRVARSDPKTKNALPEKVTVGQYKRYINTRRDLRRELKSLTDFLEDGAEDIVEIPENDYNLKTTKWQKKQMEKRLPKINERRAEAKEKISNTPMTSRGEELGYTVGEFGMPKSDQVATNPMKAFTAKQTRHDLNARFRNMLRESSEMYWNSRYEVLKQTYINTLKENYNSEDIEDVIKAIEDMDFSDFYDVFQGDAGKFEFAYPNGSKGSQEEADYIGALKQTWIPGYKI